MFGNVGFGLVIVVIRNEILYRVLGEEIFELGIELRRQCFVVRHDQGGALKVLNDVGNGECLAGSRSPQQNLIAIAFAESFNKFINRFGLIAGRFKVRGQFKFWHERILPQKIEAWK